LIPPFNADAERPDDIYPITNIITDSEWNSISISAVLKAENDRDRAALLPYNRSAWIKQKVQEAFAGRKPSKTNLYPLRSLYANPKLRLETRRKLLFAISSMFAFYNARRNVSHKEKLQERLGGVPATLLDGLLSKFSESARGSTKCVTAIARTLQSYQE
jgi:DNA-directed RNA polymerase I subunit RPA49